MTQTWCDVAVVGVAAGPRALAAAGITDVVVIDDCDVSAAVFDESTHTWPLSSTCRARVIVTSQRRSGREDLAPYLGVAVHGAPNYFMVTETADAADARLRYVVDCVRLLHSTRNTRIEVLFSTQRVAALRGATDVDSADARYWRRMRAQIPAAFDVSSHADVVDEVYSGPASLRIGDDEHTVRVQLSGRLDPIDGRFHWQGTIVDGLPEGAAMQTVQLSIDGSTAESRITERTQQGGYSISGVGVPPYALDDVDAVVPSR